MKILVVDDSLLVQYTLTKMLTEILPGVTIVPANNGLQGFDLYKREQPDLIVTDLLMPVMSGQELIRAIRETDSETRIIVITADIQKAVKEEVVGLHVNGFINKPLDDEKKTQIRSMIRGA